MIKAKDIMTSQVITVGPATKITDAAKLLIEKRINGLPVVDENGRLLGIICQSDLITEQKRFPLPSFFTLLDGFIPLDIFKLEKEVQKIVATTVEQAMTRDMITVDPEASIEEIATLMVKRDVHTVPVMSQGKLVGVIGKEDVLRTIIPLEKPN